MLFVELLDGSTVRTLQCICDSAPDVGEGRFALILVNKNKKHVNTTKRFPKTQQVG
jgi:hypothetical protein